MSIVRICAIALIVDALLVTSFVAIGRRSHAETADLAGFASALWPFLAALLLGWALSLAWRRPSGVLLPGLLIWGVTVGIGMVLRSVAGQGVQPSFVIVAGLVLAAFLLGWRLIALAVAARGRRAADRPRRGGRRIEAQVQAR
ncbi:DUF3054 domain-containing protein [Ruicaihuangia caeni]|uniref:DUF3054 domain-containing protein n=1 Tax=Ruicaihuangia caeni TaxID=3042517 RepID=UPI00338EA9EB